MRFCHTLQRRADNGSGIEPNDGNVVDLSPHCSPVPNTCYTILFWPPPALQTLILHKLPPCHTDAERLCWDADGLRTFWVHLETQRHLLQREASTARARTTQRRGRGARAHSDLCLSIQHIQMDLRDLLKQVNAQLTLLNSTNTDLGLPCSARAVPVRVTQSSSPTATSPPRRTPRSLWAQRQEGYVVLRDLNRFLFRLALDFNFLKANLPPQ
ncbi:hypothetical protein ACEWY4_008968 [Coilia grayii]|uniref:Uncharacterized protein n=1 Tax=Coilia grayii TaxID=363190 RepID=A0ABD1K560_9TELE